MNILAGQTKKRCAIREFQMLRKQNREMMISEGEVLLVLDDSGSGSSLLDQFLGARSRSVSFAEMRWLVASVREYRSPYDPEQPLICTCRAEAGECSL